MSRDRSDQLRNNFWQGLAFLAMGETHFTSTNMLEDIVDKRMPVFLFQNSFFDKRIRHSQSPNEFSLCRLGRHVVCRNQARRRGFTAQFVSIHLNLSAGNLRTDDDANASSEAPLENF